MYAASNAIEKAHKDSIWSGCWSKGGTNLIATGGIDDCVRIWDANDLTAKAEYQHNLGVISVDADNSGKYFASSSLDGHIIIYDAEERKIKTTIINEKADSEPIWSVAFSPDSKLVASGTANASVLLFDVETGEQKHKFSASRSNKYTMSVAFSPDKKYMICSSMDGSVSIFNMETQQLLHKLHEVHAMPIRSIAFSQDSQLFVTGSDDGHIKVYDVQHASQVATFSGHSSWVLSVCFNKNHIASASSDNKVKIWDYKAKECINTFTNHTDQVWSVAYNEAGTKLLSVGDDCRLQTYTCP